MYIYIYIYIYTYVYICVCMCVCMYMCVYSFFLDELPGIIHSCCTQDCVKILM